MSHPETSKRLRPGVLGAAGFVGLYLLASSVTAIAAANTEFVFYIVVMLILSAAIGLVHYKINLTTGLVWMLAIWGGLHMAGGLVPVPESWPTQGDFRVLYSWWVIPAAGDSTGWLKFDQLVHTYGFAATTWLCWQGLCGALQHQLDQLTPTFGVMVLIAAAGCGLGALNEIVEFAATKLTTTNVGGYENTGWDLVANAIGATLAAVVIYFAEKKQQATATPPQRQPAGRVR